MCGICGVIQVGGEPRQVVAPDVLDRMTDAMTHRGPNDRGTYTAPGVALGVRRLSIVDVEGGHQPFSDESGRIWAIQNGELYNHGEIRDRLIADGHRFESRCDTEILPHLYERYGDEFPKQLRGMFGLAVWDGIRGRAVVGRDRLGIKPLYYARAGDLFVFASELKSLLASGLVSIDLDYEAIDAYLSLGFVPCPRTPLAGVSKLMPGHCVVIEGGEVRIERFWSYPLPDPTEGTRADVAAEELLEQLEESVRLRLMSDVPLGAMLSGGLDSSLIVGLMARNMREPVKTFSVGFNGTGDANELSDARHVAEVFGTDHYELELSLGEQPLDLADLVWYLDEPLSDLSSLGFLTLSELASRHVTVALSGQGADELLGGYRKHQAASLCGYWNRLPSPIGALGTRIARHGPARARRMAQLFEASDPAARLIAMSNQLHPALRSDLVRGPLAELDGGAAYRAARAHLRDGLPDDPLATTLFLDAQFALTDDMLHYFDRASMARSLEVRVPFLDHHVVEHCATIPSSLKVRRLDTKHVLKRASRGLVPDRIIDKPKIGFFRDSMDAWLKAQARGAISDYLLGPSPMVAELLDRRRVEQLVTAHANGSDTGSAHLILSILILEIWLSTYLPRAVPAPTSSREHVYVPR